MPMIIKNRVRYCSTGGDAESIVYNNTESGMEATNMQDAIDELNSNFGEDVNGMTLHEKLDILLAGNDYKKDIVEAFKHSDLNLTEDMAWNEIVTKLETVYPNWEYIIYNYKVYVQPRIEGSNPPVSIVDGYLTSSWGGNDGQTLAYFDTPFHAKTGDTLCITYKLTNTNYPGRRITMRVSSSSSHSADLVNQTIQAPAATKTTYEYTVTKDTDIYVSFIFAYCQGYVSEIYLKHK